MKKTFWHTPIGKYILNNLLSLDRLGNTAIWLGSSKETISSHIGRIKEANGGKIPWYRPWPKIMDFALDKIDKNHSIDAIERDELDHIREDSLIDGGIDTQTTGKGA